MKKYILIFITLIGIIHADTLQPKMSVEVSLAGVVASETSQISGTYVINESGKLKLPHMNEGVKVSGLSSTKAAEKVAEYYKDKKIYTTPVFTILTFKNNLLAERDAIIRGEADAERIRKEAERREETQVVYVQGEAKKPGKLKLTRGMTIRILLAESGGDSEWGSSRRVILIRKGVSTEYNYKKNPDILSTKLLPGDIMEIPAGTGFGGKG